ncbi:MAG: rod shape-determining protein RodA, partial [Candidatus Omnitrophota bacterium]
MFNVRNIDKVLVLVFLVLLIFGILTLYSASSQKQADTGINFVFTQGIWIFGGLFLVCLITNIRYNLFLSIAYILYGVQIIFLISVLVTGKMALGAQRWISIGGLSFQPSEFAKIIIILTLARMIGDNPQKLKTIKGLIAPVLITLLPMVLIFKQPDLGTAIVFLPVFLSMAWVGGVRLKYFLITIFSGVLSVPFFWYFLKDY